MWLMTLAFGLGLAGLLFLVLMPPLGVFMLAVGALCAIAAGRARRAELERQRHEELLDAMRGDVSLEERGKQVQRALEQKRRR